MNTLNVLVIDDEIGMRVGTARTLKKFQFRFPGFDDNINFQIFEAETGNAGLEILNSNRIDIMILDYKLPDIHGLEILTKVTQENTDILTIMITAYASLEVAISATKKGAYDFLAKPFSPEELRNTIHKAANQVYLRRKAKELAQEKRQARFQFISVLAHELKSPLNAVENYLNIMNDNMLGQDIANYSKMIARTIKRMGGMRELITDLLDLTSIESGLKKRKLEELNLQIIVYDIIDEIAILAKEKNVSLRSDVQDIVFEADKSELVMIIKNLLTNAIKYNKDNGDVNLTISSEGDIVHIRCQDTGYGMSADEQKKLFKEFSRIINSNTQNIIGTGLGLSIVQKIVSLYDGSVEVSSEENQGTCFDISLKKPLQE